MLKSTFSGLHDIADNKGSTFIHWAVVGTQICEIPAKFSEQSDL